MSLVATLYLRRHVVKGASSGNRSLSSGIDGQPEVGELDLALGGQQDVLRLYVPVDDPLQHMPAVIRV